MDRDTNYVVVGAFVLLVIAMAVSFVFWYTDQQDKRTYRRYEIYFQGTVSGLTPGSPVRYLGVDVGKVVRISLEPQQRRRVQVTADIDSAAHAGDADAAGCHRAAVHRAGRGSQRRPPGAARAGPPLSGHSLGSLGLRRPAGEPSGPRHSHHRAGGSLQPRIQR
jgi:predicted membrane metal-binding protein